MLHAALKTIAAFLNTDGGTLLIGVSDTGEMKGLDKDYRLLSTRQNADGLEQKIRSLLRGRFQPSPFGMVEIRFEHRPEGEVCQVDVQKSEAIIHLDGDIYIRDGNVTHKLEGLARTEWTERRSR